MFVSSPVNAAPKEKPMDVKTAVNQLRDFNMQFSPSVRSDGKPYPRMTKRDKIVKAMRANGKESVAALAKGLKDPKVQMCRNASFLLGEFGLVHGRA